MAASRPARESTGTLAEVSVTTRGDVSQALVDYAREKVEKVFHYTPETVMAAHVVLTMAGDPARERPAIAEASLEFDGTRVRAQTAAVEMNEAIDLVSDRLHTILVQHRDREKTRHRWLVTQSGGGWKHGMPASPVLDHFPRKPEDREVVRRKTFALAPMSVGEAAFEMELLGHDFYLFVDSSSGNDAVVRRTAEGYAVRGDVSWPTGSSVQVAFEGMAPELTDDEARARLDLAGEPFVFYLDRETGRGRVLYLRYDGHYGLIVTAEH